jgi:hypothetical protein
LAADQFALVITHHAIEHKASIAALQYIQFAVRHYYAALPTHWNKVDWLRQHRALLQCKI